MPRRRRLAAAGMAIFFGLAFTVFRPASTPGPLERDFEAYYAAGVTVNAGGDPYSRAIWSAEQRVPGVDAQRDELLPFVGPAAALSLWSLLARLPYAAALAIWTTLLLGSLATILAAALQLGRALRDPWACGLALTLALASAPLVGALALGQAALVSAAGVAGAAVAYRAKHGAAAFGATLAAALQPNLAFVLVARIRSRWDAAVAFAAGTTFTVLTLTAGGGLTGFSSYLRHLGAHGAAERIIAIQHTPAAIAYALGLPIPLVPTLSAIIALGAVIATVTIIVRERLDPTTSTLVAGAMLPFAIPFFHEHDFVLELFPILILALRARGRARSLASVAAVLVLVDWFGLAQRHAAQGQIVCLGLAVACGFAGLNRWTPRLVRSDVAGPVTLIVLACCAVPLAHFHPAPTWPDMLPAAYHADPAATVSMVWADEQRAAGLTQRDLVWGLLRGIPLAGCLLLATALVVDARRRSMRRIRAIAHARTPVADFARPLASTTFPAPH